MNTSNGNGVHRTSSGVAITPYPTVISNYENVPSESNSNNAATSIDVQAHSGANIGNKSAEDNVLQVESTTYNSQLAVIHELNSGGNRGQASVANSDHWNLPPQTFHGAHLVRNPDGTPLLDHNNNPIPIAKMLATKPLRSEIQSRKGHGNSRVSYMSTDCVSRTLNDIFGFDGWTSEVLQVTRTYMEKNAKGQWLIVYEAKVRCTHKASGAFKEDIGVADSIHGQIQSAISNAIKAAVSDGLKRAARHFGDKLGNILYNEKFKASNAPLTLKDALIQYDIERAKSKFGFDNERNKNATDSNEATDTKAVSSTEYANRTVENSSNASVTIRTIPSNPTPLQKTNANQSSNTKVQSSYANTMTPNTSGDPLSSTPSSESIAQYGQGQKPQSAVAPSSTRQTPSVSLSVSGVDGNANSIAAPINAGNANSNGVPRFQRQVNPPNQYANGYSSSYTSQNSHYQTSGQSIERPLSLNAPPPPPFANRARSEVLNDISGTINTSSNTMNHGNPSSSSKPITCSTNQPSNLDTNGINLNQLNVYSKRKLELSNEIPSIGAQKKMNANPYSKK